MSHQRLVIFAFTAVLFVSSCVSAQQLPREQWGAPPITVSHAGGKWTIAGRKNTITINEADLSMRIDSDSAHWLMVALSR